MQFDNQNFESGVSKTMNSLKNLNESLKMKDSSKGLDGVNNSLGKLSGFGVSGLMNGVETVTARFSALGVIGMTALSNITNSAINTGKKMIEALTIDPIKTGFSEYETKIESIKTILANTEHKGTSMDDVNKALAELNEYADLTIYNFAQMTDNIGKFTAAGVDLDTSVASIKGIANLAALSGTNATKASGAMYQLSQALAAGKVQLMDWKSIENAGMGGEIFKNALIRTAQVMGTGVDAALEKYGTFNASLTEGAWLTTDVLTETLQQLSGAYTEAELIQKGYTKEQAADIVKMGESATKAATEVRTVTGLIDTMKESVQSGWATSWEYIIGDGNQATKTLTSIKDAFDAMIKPSTDARNEMLKFWNENGGREDVIKGLSTIAQSVGKGFKAVGDAWKEVFPSMSGEKLVELSAKFKDFTKQFKMSDETANKIKNTFKGVFSVFDTVKDAVVGLGKGFTPLLGVFKPLGSGFLSVTSGIGSFVTKISEAVSKTKIFEKIGDGIGSAFDKVGNVLNSAGDTISNFISKLDMNKAFGAIGKIFTKVGDVISRVADGIGKAIGTIDFSTIMDLGKTLAGLGIFNALKTIFEKFKSVGDDLSGVFDSFKGVGDGISGVLDSVKESLSAWQNSLNSGTIIKLAVAIGILAASLAVLSSIEPSRLATALSGMAGLFTELSLAMVAINAMGNISGLMKTSTSMILMATAITILAGALKKLSSIPMENMITGLVGLAATIGAMVLSVKLFSTSSSGLLKTSAGLIIFGAALHVIASAIKSLGNIDSESLGSGLFAMLGVLTELALFLAAARFGNLSLSSASAILILSGALLVLSQAMKQFGSMKTEGIIRGLAGIAGMLAEIALFAKFGGSGLNMLSLGAGLIAMSAAILVLATAMKSMGSISWSEIGKGLTSLAGALIILGAATALISGPQMLLLAVGLGAMSIALMGLATALNMLGGQSWDEIGRSLVSLAGSLTILAVAMYAMSGCIAGAAAMLVMAAAMAIFTPQLIALGQLSLEQLGIGLLALAGAFAVIAAAGYLLTGAVPGLLGFAAAVALLGVGIAAAGTGLFLFATGFTAVAASIVASGTAILDFIKQLLDLAPKMGLALGKALVNFAGAIATGGPQITAAFTTLLDSLLSSIRSNIPKIADVGMELVLEFAKKLSSGIPQLVRYGAEMILGILEGIRDNMHDIVDAGIDCVTEFINGVSDNIGEVIDAGINLALEFVEGVADGIENNQGRIESAVSRIIQAMINAGLAAIRGAINGFTSSGRQLIDGLVNGIRSRMSAAGTAVRNCVDAAKRAAGNLGSSLVGAGRSLVQGLISGITSMASSVASKARAVVQGAVNAAKSALQINSPSKVFIEIGKFVDEGFIVGMERYASKVAKTAEGVSTTAIDSFSEPLSCVSELLDSNINMDPVITPVLDLSDVQSNARRIGDMLNDETLSLNSINAGTLVGDIRNNQNAIDTTEIVSAIKKLERSINNSGSSYNINGITYDDGSNVANAVESLIRATRMERRI